MFAGNGRLYGVPEIVPSASVQVRCISDAPDRVIIVVDFFVCFAHFAGHFVSSCRTCRTEE